MGFFVLLALSVGGLLGVLVGLAVGFLAANAPSVRRRAGEGRGPHQLDLTVAAARGELDLDWSFPAPVEGRREQATPRSLRA